MIKVRLALASTRLIRAVGRQHRLRPADGLAESLRPRVQHHRASLQVRLDLTPPDEPRHQGPREGHREAQVGARRRLAGRLHAQARLRLARAPGGRPARVVRERRGHGRRHPRRGRRAGEARARDRARSRGLPLRRRHRRPDRPPAKGRIRRGRLLPPQADPPRLLPQARPRAGPRDRPRAQHADSDQVVHLRLCVRFR